MLRMIMQALRCEKQKFCTDCRKRKGCLIRKKFYVSDEKYTEYLQTVKDWTVKRAFRVKKCSMENTIEKQENKMLKKRSREMELHPTYSEE